MELENRLYTYKESADILGMKPAGLRRMCEEGRGPVITKIGRLRRFRPDALTEFIERSTERTKPEAAR